MALTKYTYSKDVNITVLSDEVEADGGITTALDHIDLIDDADPDTVDIWFVDAISGAEETALDAVVAAHANPSVPSAFICHTGAGAPDSYLGSDGDICVDPDTLEIYKKVAGAWGAAKSIDGTPAASAVVFTPDGDISSADAQAAIVEVRDDTDTKLAGKAAAGHTHGIDDLTDVDTTTSAPSVGEQLEWDGSNWVPAAAGGGGSVFGSEFTSAESLGSSSTTSTTYVQKLRLTTASLPAGDYFIQWSYQISTDKSSIAVGAKIEHDDTTVLMETNRQMPTLGQFDVQGGFAKVTLSAAVHTFDLDFKTESGAGAGANVKDARLTLWRVS